MTTFAQLARVAVPADEQTRISVCRDAQSSAPEATLGTNHRGDDEEPAAARLGSCWRPQGGGLLPPNFYVCIFVATVEVK